eukprot:evm.model.scf_1675.3 EVM.evm.TU.scf_1675.3   scf_1675:21405-33493(+)
MTYALRVTRQAESVVNQHFQRFPPSKSEIKEAVASEASDSGEASSSGTADSNGSNGKAQPAKKKFKAAANSASNFSAEQVKGRWRSVCERRGKPAMADINAAREALPIVKHREEILEAVHRNQVVLVCGETGSGKTTQLPQFILDDCWSRGQACKVICTQPRRLSAISIAERVAAERGEAVGDNVGYTIRLEAKGGPKSSLIFCTNGILLRIATKGGDMDDFTHVILDEIHERDAFADFLLITLRDILPAHPKLKLVLMSATLQHELFSEYFGGCPILHVEGRTFPVEDFYLEDILRLTGYEEEVTNGKVAMGIKKQPFSTAAQRAAVEEAVRLAFTSGSDEDFDNMMEVTGARGEGILVNMQHSKTGTTALHAAAGRGRMEEVRQLLLKGADVAIKSVNGMDAQAWAQHFGHKEVEAILKEHVEAADQAYSLRSSVMALDHYQSNTIADEVDLDLIHRLLMYICGEGQYRQDRKDLNIPMGAVLVFMPGWDEIMRMKSRLENDVFGKGRYQILALHSMIPPAEQRRVFLRPPPGVRKLILATNIAESAVTIDDVVMVINSGRLKEKSYDPYTAVSTLQSSWSSKASERQRRGRAGRCQEGVAFHLYSRARSSRLPEFQEPELKRCPLEELCLQVKMLDMPGSRAQSIAKFLARAPSPPVPKAVEHARSVLLDIGALTEDECLTTLGRHLAALPLPPQLGKLCLYGILFKCLDPVLTVACSMSYRDPWLNPTGDGERAMAKSIRTDLADLGGGGSDHLATVAVYGQWLLAKRTGREREFCRRNFVSNSTLMMIHGMREQLAGELHRQGLAGSIESCSARVGKGEIVRCILACGLYPRVGYSDFGKPGVIWTRKGEKAFIHPASVNTKLSAPMPVAGESAICPLVAYDELTRGESRLYIRSCTALQPHPLPLIAGTLELLEPDEEEQHEQHGRERGKHRRRNTVMLIDRWLRFEASEGMAMSLCVLRKRLQRAFAQKVNAARSPLSAELQDAVDSAGRFMSDATSSGAPGPADDAPPPRQFPHPNQPAGAPNFSPFHDLPGPAPGQRSDWQPDGGDVDCSRGGAHRGGRSNRRARGRMRGNENDAQWQQRECHQSGQHAGGQQRGGAGLREGRRRGARGPRNHLRGGVGRGGRGLNPNAVSFNPHAGV